MFSLVLFWAKTAGASLGAPEGGSQRGTYLHHGGG